MTSDKVYSASQDQSNIRREMLEIQRNCAGEGGGSDGEAAARASDQVRVIRAQHIVFTRWISLASDK